MSASSSSSKDHTAQTGLVVATHGRHVVVQASDGRKVLCHGRGKKPASVVGDQVLWAQTGDEGVIDKVLPRSSLFYRQDEMRTKLFAANVQQLLVLIAADPVFSEVQLARALVAAQAAAIPAVIGLNKRDLTGQHEQALQKLLPYRSMGYTVLSLGVKEHEDATRDALLPLLQGKATLLLGPSGAGKSSLINLLVDGAAAATNTVSKALNSGKHTTTSTLWYWIDQTRGTALIDSPGFQSFGLRHIALSDLVTCMPDIHALAQECRFYNCTHLHEPGCGVISRLSELGPRRYAIYRELYGELSGQAP